MAKVARPSTQHGVVVGQESPQPRLQSRAGVVAAAESILEIDRARNGLVHSKPTPGKPAWDVGGAVQSESLRKGLEAAQGLMTALGAEPTPRG